MARSVKATIKKSSLSAININQKGYPSPQSFCVIDSNNRVVIHKHTNEKSAEIVRYSANKRYPKTKIGKREGRGHSTILGHCNGCTYCNATNEIIVTRYRGEAHHKQVAVFDADSLKYKRTINLPVKASALAYDRVTGNMYVGCGQSMHVFTLSNFMAGKKQSKTHHCKFRGTWQDIGGFGGIIYRIVTVSVGRNNYIDCYQASDGKYVGSIHVPFYEIESCAVDENNILHMVSTNQRYLMKTNLNVSKLFSGVTGAIATIAGGISAVTGMVTEGVAADVFVATAKAEADKGIKESGNNNVKYNTWYYGKEVSGDRYAWCAVFIAWCANTALGNNNTIPKNAMAHGIQEGVVKNGGAWVLNGSFPKNETSASKCKPGDIITFDSDHNGTANHVGIIEKVNGKTLHTIEGNHGNKVAKVSRSISEVFRVARPAWPDGTFSFDGVLGGELSLSLQVSPETLYSSAGYDYEEETELESEEDKKNKERAQLLRDFLSNISIDLSDSNAIPDEIILPSISSASSHKKPRTRVTGSVSSSSLPSTINYVEAPYAIVTLGGESIGAFKGRNYPNYMNGLTVKKTNGSLNEYTINLIHQIAPGDNPNYIDNLISANGYNKIGIEYGDAEYGITYRDINALITNVRSNFDFFNNCISYTISATSASVMSSVVRKNYAAVEDKPSTIISKMLYETGELLEYFPGMANQSLVNSKGLIPTNDQKVSIDAVTNTTPLNYMNKLVSVMAPVNETNDRKSVYYLDLSDDKSLMGGPYFKIKQINSSMPASAFPFMYEVDVGYPNESALVYNFSVDTDYYWPLAYEYSGGFINYNYDIDNSGRTTLSKDSSNLKSIMSTDEVKNSDAHWWKNVTEFPIKATLEVKGLTSYVLLLNYIKINALYFGKKRSTSGVYIVTGQEDSISGNGFKTKLSLLRVAGDNQYIAVDGRIAT